MPAIFDDDPKAATLLPPEPTRGKPAPAKKAAAKKGANPAPLRLGAGAKGTGGRPSNADLQKELKTRLEQLAGYLLLAGLVSPRIAYDGEILANNAEAIAKELFKQAQKNPRVKAALESLFAASEWGGTLAVVGAVLVPILANHGVLPAAAALVVKAPLPPAREPKAPKAPKASTVPGKGRPPMVDLSKLRDHAETQQAHAGRPLQVVPDIPADVPPPILTPEEAGPEPAPFVYVAPNTKETGTGETFTLGWE